MHHRIYATATLKHLAECERLHTVDLIAGEARERVARFLREVLAKPEGLSPDACPPHWAIPLEERFLIRLSEVPVPAPGLPFKHVKALNFELTYACNLACGHCHQDRLRPVGHVPWLARDVVLRAMEDASFLGLTAVGVNFTGGEVCMPGSPVLELIAAAAQAGLEARCNTNAWWGGRTGFRVGATTFASDTELVQQLKALGLTRLALSVDHRYEQYPDLLPRMERVAMLCEQTGLEFEFVRTDPPEVLVSSLLSRLHARANGPLKHLSKRERARGKTPAIKDAVDIGASAGPAGAGLDTARLAELAAGAPCRKKGFYRPWYLHVNPQGGVRTCMLAPGAEVLGNLSHERLPQLLNRADENPVVRLFGGGQLDAFVTTNLAPYRHLYRNVEHPCAASALIARSIAALAAEANRMGRALTTDEQREVHTGIAASWNLTPSPPPRSAS